MNLLPPRVAPEVVPSARGRSYDYCQQLAQREAGNFYHAFRLLPLDQRRGMCAVYSFLRIADDLADAAAPVPTRRAQLAAWRRQLRDSQAGLYRHPVFPALHHTMQRFGIPSNYLEAVLDGVEMDLDTDRYETFADLYRYCYRVASAVGLACVHIWGFTRDRALEYAEAAGIAFQLTNILRDLGEDAGRGRVYLPAEDLRWAGYDASGLALGRQDEHFRELMRFQVRRAREYYTAAKPLVGMLHPAGRAVFLVMLRTYRALLDEIERRNFDVFRERVRLSRMHKLWLAAQALPVRWGFL